MSFDVATRTTTVVGGPCDCEACCECADSTLFGRFDGTLQWYVAPGVYLADNGAGSADDSVEFPSELGVEDTTFFPSGDWEPVCKTRFNPDTCYYELNGTDNPTLTTYPNGAATSRTWTYAATPPKTVVDSAGVATGYTGAGWFSDYPPDTSKVEAIKLGGDGTRNDPFIAVWKHPVWSDGPYPCDFPFEPLSPVINYLAYNTSTTLVRGLAWRCEPSVGATWVTDCARMQQFWPVDTCMIQTIVDVQTGESLERVLYPVPESAKYVRDSSRCFNWSPTSGQHLDDSEYFPPPSGPDAASLTGSLDTRYGRLFTMGQPGGAAEFHGSRLTFASPSKIGANWNGSSYDDFAYSVPETYVPYVAKSSTGGNGLLYRYPDPFSTTVTDIVREKEIEFSMDVRVISDFHATRGWHVHPDGTYRATTPDPIPSPSIVSATRTDVNDYDLFPQWIGLGQTAYTSGTPADWQWQSFGATITGYTNKGSLASPGRIVSHDPFIYEYWAKTAINGEFRYVYGTITPGDCGSVPPPPPPVSPPTTYSISGELTRLSTDVVLDGRQVLLTGKASKTTAASGVDPASYSFTGLRAGSYTVRPYTATNEYSSPESRTVTLPISRVDQDFTIGKFRCVFINTYGLDGSNEIDPGITVSGYTFQVQDKSGKSYGNGPVVCGLTTGDYKVVTIETPCDAINFYDQWEIVGGASGKLQEGIPEFTLDGTGDVTVNYGLDSECGCTITGTVTSANNSEPSVVGITVTATGKLSTLTTTVSTGGTFTFASVPVGPDTYTISLPSKYLTTPAFLIIEACPGGAAGNIDITAVESPGGGGGE